MDVGLFLLDLILLIAPSGIEIRDSPVSALVICPLLIALSGIEIKEGYVHPRSAWNLLIAPSGIEMSQVLTESNIKMLLIAPSGIEILGARRLGV